MKESYRKGVANRLASSLAEAVARLPWKRRQRYQWGGYGAAKTLNRDPDPVTKGEGHTHADASASIWQTQYNCDSAGGVSSWTHPAGFTITNRINSAQQITGVTSSQNDSTHPPTLAQNITYTPWGALASLQNGCAGTNRTQTHPFVKAA